MHMLALLWHQILHTISCAIQTSSSLHCGRQTLQMGLLQRLGGVTEEAPPKGPAPLPLDVGCAAAGFGMGVIGCCMAGLGWAMY